jgi:hypothetical protein
MDDVKGELQDVTRGYSKLDNKNIQVTLRIRARRFRLP